MYSILIAKEWSVQESGLGGLTLLTVKITYIVVIYITQEIVELACKSQLTAQVVSYSLNEVTYLHFVWRSYCWWSWRKKAIYVIYFLREKWSIKVVRQHLLWWTTIENLWKSQAKSYGWQMWLNSSLMLWTGFFCQLHYLLCWYSTSRYETRINCAKTVTHQLCCKQAFASHLLGNRNHYYIM